MDLAFLCKCVSWGGKNVQLKNIFCAVSIYELPLRLPSDCHTAANDGHHANCVPSGSPKARMERCQSLHSIVHSQCAECGLRPHGCVLPTLTQFSPWFVYKILAGSTSSCLPDTYTSHDNVFDHLHIIGKMRSKASAYWDEFNTFWPAESLIWVSRVSPGVSIRVLQDSLKQFDRAMFTLFCRSWSPSAKHHLGHSDWIHEYTIYFQYINTEPHFKSCKMCWMEEWHSLVLHRYCRPECADVHCLAEICSALYHYSGALDVAQGSWQSYHRIYCCHDWRLISFHNRWILFCACLVQSALGLTTSCQQIVKSTCMACKK